MGWYNFAEFSKSRKNLKLPKMFIPEIRNFWNLKKKNWNCRTFKFPKLSRDDIILPKFQFPEIEKKKIFEIVEISKSRNFKFTIFVGILLNFQILENSK